MNRYELNQEDMALIDRAFGQVISDFDGVWEGVGIINLRDLRERFHNAHVVYIETEEQP